jgi:hypothetical protein
MVWLWLDLFTYLLGTTLQTFRRLAYIKESANDATTACWQNWNNRDKETTLGASPKKIGHSL